MDDMVSRVDGPKLPSNSSISAPQADTFTRNPPGTSRLLVQSHFRAGWVLENFSRKRTTSSQSYDRININDKLLRKITTGSYAELPVPVGWSTRAWTARRTFHMGIPSLFWSNKYRTKVLKKMD